MGYKLKTSKEAQTLIDRMESSENLPWYTLARLAIALSIRQGPLLPGDFTKDNDGKELNRYTIVGDDDAVFKCLAEIREGRYLSDEEYFPAYVKGHLDRGARLLDQEQRYSNNLLIQLTEMEKSI